MSRILIEVDEQVARAFENTKPENKEKLNFAINALLKKSINDSDIKNYKQILDNLSDEATKNGLNENILEDLLASND
jgi:hypothetical protein